MQETKSHITTTSRVLLLLNKATSGSTVIGGFYSGFHNNNTSEMTKQQPTAFVHGGNCIKVWFNIVSY
jgi:hypothetical protein